MSHLQELGRSTALELVDNMQPFRRLAEVKLILRISNHETCSVGKAGHHRTESNIR